MDLYYAAGGGLGHVTRARRVLRSLGSDATIVTTSPYAAALPVTSSPIRRVPESLAQAHEGAVTTRGLALWIEALIDELRPARTFVDTFPAGLFGELPEVAALRSTELLYLGRLLRWDAYEPLLGAHPLSFEKALLLEPLTESHDSFIRKTSLTVEDFSIEDHYDRNVDGDGDGEPTWLVSHSGPADEVLQLLDYAMEMRRIERSEARVVLATVDPPPDLPPDIAIVSQSRARSLFASATRIITGAGFNSMWEHRDHRHKHRFIAFPRRFDDQFLRARRARFAHA